MNLYKKSIIIYGIDRIQKDFEYMFPNLNIKAYICDDNLECLEYNSKKCYNINDITKDEIGKNLIVICARRSSKIENYFINIGLKKDKDFVYAEDLGKYLDSFKDYFIAKVKYYNNIYIKKNKGYKIQYIKNSELFKKMIYEDSYDGLLCRFPFEYVNIQPNGDVYSCCESWGYHNIGSLFVRNPDSIWNSNAAKLHRLAIINKTYAFCDRVVCPYLNQNMNKTNERFLDVKEEESPQKVYVSIDRSCNLHCKSCRNAHFNAKGMKLKQVKFLYNKLINSKWVLNSDKLVLAGQGEVFYSEMYQKMLFNEKVVKTRDSIEILTNGTLLTKEKLDKLCKAYNNIKIYITMDAATKDTYSKIRLGGNFDALMNNLKKLSDVKKQGKVQYVELLYIVQQKNYKEMIEFIKLAKKLNFDKVSFSQISNWGTFSNKEFKKVSMLDSFGKPKVELKNILKDKLIKDEIVNYTNITKFVE